LPLIPASPPVTAATRVPASISKFALRYCTIHAPSACHPVLLASLTSAPCEVEDSVAQKDTG